MNRILLTTIPAVLLAVLAAPDLATAQSDDGVVENVVVRNRKYIADGKLEVNPGIGLPLGSRLTSHTNFELGLAYNLFEQFAVELRGTFSTNGLTSVGEDVRNNIYTIEDPFVPSTAERKDDFTDLWRLQYSGLVLPRWTPIYGKINLATELPIHFQGYLTAGAGLAGLKRESLVYCQGGSTSTASRGDACPDGGYLESSRTGYAIAAGGGLRFFMADWALLKLELLNVSYPDKQLTQIQRREAEGQAPGSDASFATETGAGFTSLFFINIGTSFQF